MTDPTPPPDLEEVKKRHVQGAGGVIGMPRVCMECAQVWPCDAIRIIQPFEEMVHWKNNIIQDNFENAYVEATLLHDAKKEISRLTRELETEREKSRRRGEALGRIRFAKSSRPVKWFREIAIAALEENP